MKKNEKFGQKIGDFIFCKKKKKILLYSKKN